MRDSIGQNWPGVSSFLFNQALEIDLRTSFTRQSSAPISALPANSNSLFVVGLLPLAKETGRDDR